MKLAETEQELEKFWEATSSGTLYGRRNGKWAPACAQDLNDKRILEAVCDRFGYK